MILKSSIAKKCILLDYYEGESNSSWWGIARPKYKTLAYRLILLDLGTGGAADGRSVFYAALFFLKTLDGNSHMKAALSVLIDSNDSNNKSLPRNFSINRFVNCFPSFSPFLKLFTFHHFFSSTKDTNTYLDLLLCISQALPKSMRVVAKLCLPILNYTRTFISCQ